MTAEMTISSIKHKCNKCKDTGWYYYTDSNGYEFQAECECGQLARERMNKRLSFANLPDGFKDMKLKDFQIAVYQNPRSKEIVRTACSNIKYYLDNFEDMKSKGRGLYLYSGTKGSGKTRMIVSIANELMSNKGVSVKFATSTSIISEIKSTYGNKEGYSESALLDALVTTEVLIIDDFGTENVTGWVNEKYYEIINGRYVDKKVTLLTSNMELSDLNYDDRITNRLKEMCYRIPFPEESVRDHIADELQREMNNKR